MFRRSRVRQSRAHCQSEQLESRVLLAIPRGGEFQVNTFTPDKQLAGGVAIDSDGDFVVAWRSTEQGNSYSFYTVQAQRFNASGVKQGAQFKVSNNSYLLEPEVAMDAAGNFVVAWTGGDQDQWGIFARQYDSTGSPLGSEFLVNTVTANRQENASIAVDADGDFVITWLSVNQEGDASGIYARRYNAMGVAQGTEFLVNTITTGNQTDPSIAMDPAGHFVISWTLTNQSDIYARRFDSSGSPQGSEFLVNTTTTSFQVESSVAMDDAGNFVVTWQGVDPLTGKRSIYGQAFDAADTPRRSEFRANTLTSENLFTPRIAMSPDGDFVITWYGAADSQHLGGNEIMARNFDSDGVAHGPEFLVNTFTGSVVSPVVAIDPDGDALLVWTSADQDGSDYGVFARRFVFVTLDDGTLSVLGTSGNDNISLTLQSQSLKVTVNGENSTWDDTDIVHINIQSGSGNDRITIGAGIIGTYVLGGEGNDCIVGGDGNDTFFGGSGKDTLLGNSGADLLYGGKHNDKLDGGDGKDRAYGGDGNDTILGGSQNDTLYGENGNDSLDGGNQSDRLYGGAGRDTGHGGAGNDGFYDPDDNLIDRFDGGGGVDFARVGNEDILLHFEA